MKRKLSFAVLIAAAGVVLFNCGSLPSSSPYMPPPAQWVGAVYRGGAKPLLEGASWTIIWKRIGDKFKFAQAGKTAPAASALQTGRYAYGGTTISMAITPSQVTAYSGYKQVAFGTVRRKGNQLVLSFQSGFDEGASLNGKTFAYTITGSTSFSGGGENWVRTGY